MSSRLRLLGLSACCLLATALTGCARTAATGASALCEAPALSAHARAYAGTPASQVVTVIPGQMLRIYGSGYATCHDTNHQPPSRPFKHLAIFITQGHRQQTLAAVSAHLPGGNFEVTVEIPADLRPGPAVVRTSSRILEEPLRLNVRHSARSTTGGATSSGTFNQQRPQPTATSSSTAATARAPGSAISIV